MVGASRNCSESQQKSVRADPIGADRALRTVRATERAATFSPCRSTSRGYSDLPFLALARCDCQRATRPIGPPSAAPFHPPNPADRFAGQGEVPMKIRPLQDRLLVKRIEEEEKSKGGIIIPDTAKEKPAGGRGICGGKGKVSDDGKLHPLDGKKGDRILFSKDAGTEVQEEGDGNIIIREDED